MTEPRESTKERIAWEGWCSLELTSGWSWTEEDGVITIFHEAGVGALQISCSTRESRGPVNAQESLELADRIRVTIWMKTVK
jgi:hypothetical protein